MPWTRLASTGCLHSFASDGDDESGKGEGGCSRNTQSAAPGQSNCFRNAQWSADGTTIVTHSQGAVYRTFIVPHDLLAPDKPRPQALFPYASAPAPTPSHAFALYPGFDLAQPGTCLSAQSQADLPIRLVNVLAPATVTASYPLVDPLTEAWIAPHSLRFSLDGSLLLAGAKEQLAVFDVSRPNAGPLSSMRTRSGRKARVYGEGKTPLLGLVTALDVDAQSNVLAAGSTGRCVALYEHGGRGQAVTAFRTTDRPGGGVSSLRWSACGRYLFVAERQSHDLLVYDIRGAGRLLGWLEERRAHTTLPLGFELAGAQGHDVVAGGTDGCVRTWKDVVSKEGGIPADVVEQCSTDSISNVLLHSSGAVAATTSGQREVRSSPPDNSLSLWLVPAEAE